MKQFSFLMLCWNIKKTYIEKFFKNVSMLELFIVQIIKEYKIYFHYVKGQEMDDISTSFNDGRKIL